MPSATMDPTAEPPPDLHDDDANERLRKLEPYLLDRTEQKRASASSRNPPRARHTGTSGVRKPGSGRPKPPTTTSSSSSSSTSSSHSTSRLGLRRFLRSNLHLLAYTTIHLLFSIYIRLRQALATLLARTLSVFAHHHNTPELIRRDVRPLSKLPAHLAVVLRLEDVDEGEPGGGRGCGAGLEHLIDEVADVAAWCASAGIPVVSVYERTGVLKSFMGATHRAVGRKMALFFGRTGRPGVSISAPHLEGVESEGSFSPGHPGGGGTGAAVEHVHVMLLSAEDGRTSIVDLTRTLAEMAQRGKLRPRADISVDLVDAELKEGIVDEPDLVIVFGPYPDLDGYPPWQLRLAEIFAARDNTSGVGYQVFLKGLYKYANAEMRWGR